MINPNTNYVIADYISNLRFGMIRGMRFFRVNKTFIGLRLTQLLYDQGVLRSYKIEEKYIKIFSKFHMSRHIISKLVIVSKPSNRIYWRLGRLAKEYNDNSFSGFYIISTQYGLFTSDYCLLYGHISGEVLVKVCL